MGGSQMQGTLDSNKAKGEYGRKTKEEEAEESLLVVGESTMQVPSAKMNLEVSKT